MYIASPLCYITHDKHDFIDHYNISDASAIFDTNYLGNGLMPNRRKAIK